MEVAIDIIKFLMWTLVIIVALIGPLVVFTVHAKRVKLRTGECDNTIYENKRAASYMNHTDDQEDEIIELRSQIQEKEKIIQDYTDHPTYKLSRRVDELLDQRDHLLIEHEELCAVFRKEA